MASFNKVILMGNLTGDPELRQTGNGSAVCGFQIAVNRRWRDNSGNDQEEVCFAPITVWGRVAENCAQYLAKGSPVMIEGRLKLDQWEDRNSGEKRSKLSIIAENVQFLGSRADNGGGQPQGGQQQSGQYRQNPGNYQGGGSQQPPPRPNPQQQYRPEDQPGYAPDDDIPF